MSDETGVIGSKTDPTPEANYSVEGVASGAPTPETDDDQRREANRALGRPVEFGIGPRSAPRFDDAANDEPEEPAA